MSAHASPIETRRLRLIAIGLDHLDTELHAPEKLAGMLGASVPASWPPGLYDRDAMQFFHGRLTEGGEAAAGWYGWYAIARPATLVACGGYFGPPTEDGLVEIGYSVAPEFRRQGFATEMIEALLRRALERPGVKTIVAETSADNIGSRRALEKCGFHVTGPGREAGHVRYER
jgi:RimJ/RimL family protein N-acetyltransferase